MRGDMDGQRRGPRLLPPPAELRGTPGRRAARRAGVHPAAARRPRAGAPAPASGPADDGRRSSSTRCGGSTTAGSCCSGRGISRLRCGGSRTASAARRRASTPSTGASYGAFGPVAIADGLVAAALEQRTLPGEAHFLLAELALTVAAVDWRAVAAEHRPWQASGALVAEVLDAIDERRHDASRAARDPALDAYVRDALEAARR